MVNVLDFGAKADNGATDNSVAFQAAIDSVAAVKGAWDNHGGVVHVPARPPPMDSRNLFLLITTALPCEGIPRRQPSSPCWARRIRYYSSACVGRKFTTTAKRPGTSSLTPATTPTSSASSIRPPCRCAVSAGAFAAEAARSCNSRPRRSRSASAIKKDRTPPTTGHKPRR